MQKCSLNIVIIVEKYKMTYMDRAIIIVLALFIFQGEMYKTLADFSGEKVPSIKVTR